MKLPTKYIIVLIVLLSGCYPPGPEATEELDLVFTNYSEDYQFQSANTYSMPDQIVKVTGNLEDGEAPEFVKEPYNTQVLDQIENNMSALGWTRVDDPDNADLVLFPAVWSNTTVYYWYDYWCWYYPYYCGWGWYYPVVSSYTTGTLVMTLVADGDNFVEPSRVWTGAINGLLTGAYNAGRVEKGIDQAFVQSPYLQIN